jgi:hypothetical protein
MASFVAPIKASQASGFVVVVDVGITVVPSLPGQPDGSLLALGALWKIDLGTKTAGFER